MWHNFSPTKLQFFDNTFQEESLKDKLQNALKEIKKSIAN
jgi:hypothetical protein